MDQRRSWTSSSPGSFCVPMNSIDVMGAWFPTSRGGARALQCSARAASVRTRRVVIINYPGGHSPRSAPPAIAPQLRWSATSSKRCSRRPFCSFSSEALERQANRDIASPNVSWTLPPLVARRVPSVDTARVGIHSDSLGSKRVPHVAGHRASFAIALLVAARLPFIFGVTLTVPIWVVARSRRRGEPDASSTP